MTKRPIRVFVALWRLAPGGGVPAVVRGILQHFDRREFEFHVCTIRPLSPEDAIEKLGNGITYHPLGFEGPPSLLSQVRAMLGVARIARRVQPDILHVNGGTASYSLLASLCLRRVEKVIEVHDAPQSGRMSRANQVLERVLGRWLGFRPMVHSRAVRQDLAVAWEMAASEISLLRLGIDSTAFAPDSEHRRRVRARLGLGPEVPLVTYVARMVAEKRPGLFVEVARRVLAERPNARFALVGTGNRLQEMRELVNELDLAERVFLPGFVDDVAGVYRASDIFVSTSQYEGFGLALAEAMAAGVPVVSTLVGGVEDVVGDAGILEPSSNPARLAAHILTLLRAPELRQMYAKAGRERVRSCLEVRDTVRGYERFYRGLLD